MAIKILNGIDVVGSMNITASDIPSLDANKITTGTLAAARIPSLDASKIGSGTFTASRIPNLDGSKITTGTIAAARIADLSATYATVSSVPTNVSDLTNDIGYLSSLPSHNHDDRYYTETEINTRTVETFRGGKSIDDFGTYILAKDDGGWTGSTAGRLQGAHNGYGVISMHLHTGGYYGQIHLSANTEDIGVRFENNDSGWGQTYTVWTSKHFDHNSFLTSVAWNDVTGKPTLDNYVSWNLKTNSVQRTTVGSGGDLNLVAGTNVTLAYSAGGTVTISSTDTNTTYSVGDGGLTEKNFTSALKTKLDGIEAGADVTDSANVSAAGALMTSGGTISGTVTVNEFISVRGGNNASIGTYNNPSATSVNLGTYIDAYAFIDLSSSATGGGWIDFSKADGTDYSGRIRYENSTDELQIFTAGRLTTTIESNGTASGSWGHVNIYMGNTWGGTTSYYPTIGSKDGSAGSLIMLDNPHIPWRTDNAASSSYSGRAGLRMAYNSSGSWWDAGVAGDFFHIYRQSGGEFFRITNNGNVGINRVPASNEKISVNAEEGIWTLASYQSEILVGGIHTNGGRLTLRAESGGDLLFANAAEVSDRLTVQDDLIVNGGRLKLYNTNHGAWDDGLMIDDPSGWAATIYRRSNAPKMFTGLRSGTDNFIWMSPLYNNTGTVVAAPRTDAVLEVKTTNRLEVYLPTDFGQDVTAPNLAVSNWNTAYSWGNHAGLYAAASHTHPYLPLGGGTLSGNLNISKDNPILILNETNASSDAGQIAYISFQDNGAEEAWIGWGSNGNTDFTIRNVIGKVVLNGGGGAYVGNARILTTSDSSSFATASHNHDSSYINVGGDTMTGILKLNAGVTNNNWSTFTHLEGAYNVNNPSGTAGAIRIELPTAENNTNTMMTMTVKVYEYSTGKSFTLFLGGYNYSNGVWYNTFASMVGDNERGDITVRFGNNGARNIIWIGEPSASWSYPNVWVTDFQSGHTQGQDWNDGWRIVFDQTESTNVTASQTAHKQITTSNIGSQTVANAGQLDGIDSSQFMRSDVNDSFTATPTFAKGSSGVLAARTGYSDFLGYNPTYGSYIGGGVGNAVGYLYAGGYFHDGNGVRTLFHTGNFTDNSTNWNTAYSWGNHASAGYAAGSHSHSNYLRSDAYDEQTAGFKVRDIDIGYRGDRTIQALDSTGTINTTGDLHLQHFGGNLHTVHGGGTLYVNDAAITSGKIGNWDTAYGWGNHASAGYITSLAGYATETYVGQQISNLVASAPSTLDTLNELAAALGDDPNFATTVTNSIATKLPFQTYNSGTDLNTINRSTFGAISTGNASPNTNQNYSAVYSLGVAGIPNTLQLGTASDYNASGLWVRQYNQNAASPQGTGWQNWTKVWTDNDFANNSANWNTAYADRYKWNGGSSGLNAATGRTSLGLGTAATSNTGDFATAAQGTKADTAFGWGNHASAGYLTSYTETDTLASVTSRGASTTTSLSIRNLTSRTIVPETNVAYDLGTPEARWQIVFCQTLDSAGQHESQLQNPEGEKSVGDYATGTVLVWKGGKNIPCTEAADHMRMGIAVNGIDSPLVQGAEPVLVTGSVNEGDYLVTSSVEGHAKAITPQFMRQHMLFDCVIGKALESGEGDSHLIKTWINI